jgi:putative AbiEi antitoxin of type IV toxin-antitoxin system/uncharacterized protein DUF559
MDVPELSDPIRPSGPARDRELAKLATRQHGVVTLRQLLAFGFTRVAVRRRLSAGRLHPIHPGVYAVGHPRLTVKGLFIAAVHYGGEGALLSHRSAAELWGLISPSSLVDVTIASHRRRRGNVVWHEARTLHSDDRATKDGIPVTSVARTLLDVAEVLSKPRLERVLEDAERLRLFDLRKLQELLSRSPGRRGVKPLRAVLQSQSGSVPMTRSELERAFLDFCDEVGLPRPAPNVWVEGFEVDGVWPDAALIVELDSFEFHRTRAAFERDRARDTKLQVAGYRVVRVTDRRLTGERSTLEQEIKRLRAAAHRRS